MSCAYSYEVFNKPDTILLYPSDHRWPVSSHDINNPHWFFSLCSYSKIKVSSFIHIYNENIYTHLLWSTFQSHFSTDLYHWGLKIHTRDLCCQCIYSKTIHKQNRLFFYRQTSRMARSDNFLPLDGVGVFRKKYYKSLFSWQTTLDFIKKHFKKYIAIPNNLQIDIETPRLLFFF